MNWTGGNLQRHSRKSGHNATIEKQKQHFAKNRTRLQNGHVARPAIFGEDLEDEQAIRRQFTPARRQSKLEGFTDFAPVVDRLESMTPKHLRVHDSGSRSSKQVSSQKLQPFSQQSQPKPRQPADNGPTFKRPRTDQGLGLSASQKLEQQRQLLLGKSDWVGLQTAKSLHHDFVSDRGNDNFGKRRRVDKEAPHRQHNPDHAHRVYVSSVRDFPRGRDNQPVPDTTLSDSIQIKIGNDALTSRMSSQYAETARDTHLQVASSSSMIPDDDDSQDPAQHSQFSNFRQGRQKLHDAQSESPLGRFQGQARNNFVEATDEDYKIATDIGSGHNVGSNPASTPQSHRHKEVRSPHVSESVFGSTGSSRHERRHSPFLFVQKQALPHEPARDEQHEETGSDIEEEAQAEQDHQTSKLADDAWQQFINTAAVDDSEAAPEGVLPTILKHKTQAQPTPSPQPPLPSLFTIRQIDNAPIAVMTTTKPDTAPVPPTPASLKALETLCKMQPPQAAATAPESIAQTPNSLKALKTLCQASAPPVKAAMKKSKPVHDPDAAWKAFVFGHKATPAAEPAASDLNALAPAIRPPVNSSTAANPPTPKHQQRYHSSSFLTSIASSSSHADARTTAAIHDPSSSTAFQSDTGVVSPLQTHRTGSVASFDRPSSIANASIMPAVLRTDAPRPLQRISSPDPLQGQSSSDPLTAGHAQGRKKTRMVFSKPKPFGRMKERGGDEMENADESVVYIGRSRGKRARARAEEVGSEVEEVDVIEDD